MRNSHPVDRHPIINFLFGFGFISMTQKIILFLLLVIVQIGLFALSLVFNNPNGSLLIYWIYLFSLIPFLAMLYGILWGKYGFRIERIDLVFPDLPDSFDGFKIVQISDAHSGTWDSKRGVHKGIRLMNDLQADLIVFTGDLVNANKDEIDPFIELFKELSAPYGKFAILGNHDYYGQPREKELRPAYYEAFFRKYEEMGFELLRNDSCEINNGKEIIKLIGVENWGSGRYFPKRGDLDVATANCKEGDFCILLSHDPSHWDLKALAFGQHFHLTLSGHTHGMQFGINLPFFRWSPVQYRYKRWMGLYKEADQYLYVNRGFGFLAYPGRVGMSPEITQITLRKGK